MNHHRFFLALGCALVLAVPAPAGIFFGKHPKPNPAERVPQLLATLKTDPDEGKRTSAAKALREFDPSAFPEMMPILIDVLKHDPQAGVRLEVIQTLGKLRPISQNAGVAMEEALGDSSWRVRWQARQTLWLYRASGYRSPAKPEEAAPPSTAKAGQPKSRPNLVPKDTPPPPLADPAPAVRTSSSPPGRLETPRLKKPVPLPSEDGPDLPIGK
jgi:hypothetical protein